MAQTGQSAIENQPKENFVRSVVRKSFAFKKQQVPKQADLLCQVLAGDERIHQSALVNEPTSVPDDPEVRTIYDVLQRGLRLSNNGPYLGERDSNGKYQWLDYKTVIENAQFVGSAIQQLGLKAGQETRVAIAGIHSIEYITVGHALSSYSMVFVPLYYNYCFKDLMEIVNKCRIELIFCDNYKRAREYIEKSDELPTLKHIVLLKSDKEDPVPDAEPKNSEVNVYDWSYILELGKNNVQESRPPKPDDIYGIFHSSGTSDNNPKGALISHRALLATATGPTIQWFGKNQKLKLGSADKYFSFLSPAHVYEQIMQVIATFYGARIGIYSGSVPKLLDDLQALKPTFVAFVPRLLTKFQTQIKTQLKQKSRLVQKLFDFAVKYKTKDLLNGKIDYNTIWDKTIFKPIHKLVGGNLKFIVTGGSSIAPDVKYFSAIVYGCPVFEGYGQTECAAAATLTITSDTTVGHIGVPSPWAQIKLISVPELGYNTENDEGEICIRGAGVMDGYFEQPELTKQTIDNEGWLKTGDIGRWRPNGNLELIDRKINFFKLSQGDYVSPERAEAIYQNCPLISQLFIYGRQTESYLIAIIVPVVGHLKEIVGRNETTKHLLEIESTADFLQSAELNKIGLEYLREYGKSNGLNELELIRRIYFEQEEFTPDNNLLTPTLKMKRSFILQKYSKIIDELYTKD